MKFFRRGQRYVRAGLKRREKFDHRRLMLSSFIESDSKTAYSVCQGNWMPGYDVGDLGNVTFGCCAYAAPAHLINTSRMQRHRGELITTDMVLREYSKWTGFDPEIDATDNGAYLLDVMKQWASEEGLFGTRIIGFAEVDMTNDDELAFACYTLGGVIAAFGLPTSAQDEEEVWDDTRDGPWSWGGHAIYTCDTSPGRDAGISWGERTSWTRRWRHKYSSEGYVVLLEEMREELESESGLNFNGLLAAVERVRRM